MHFIFKSMSSESFLIRLSFKISCCTCGMVHFYTVQPFVMHLYSSFWIINAFFSWHETLHKFPFRTKRTNMTFAINKLYHLYITSAISQFEAEIKYMHVVDNCKVQIIEIHAQWIYSTIRNSLWIDTYDIIQA